MSSSTAPTSTSTKPATGMLSGFGFNSGSWGVGFGRKKKSEPILIETVEGESETRRDGGSSSSAARQLLKKF